MNKQALAFVGATVALGACAEDSPDLETKCRERLPGLFQSEVTRALNSTKVDEQVGAMVEKAIDDQLGEDRLAAMVESAVQTRVEIEVNQRVAAILASQEMQDFMTEQARAAVGLPAVKEEVSKALKPAQAEAKDDVDSLNRQHVVDILNAIYDQDPREMGGRFFSEVPMRVKDKFNTRNYAEIKAFLLSLASSDLVKSFAVNNVEGYINARVEFKPVVSPFVYMQTYGLAWNRESFGYVSDTYYPVFELNFTSNGNFDLTLSVFKSSKIKRTEEAPAVDVTSGSERPGWVNMARMKGHLTTGAK